jgi:hypothetical protein
LNVAKIPWTAFSSPWISGTELLSEPAPWSFDKAKAYFAGYKEIKPNETWGHSESKFYAADG